VKLFIQRGGRLAALPLPAKLVYSGFLVFIAIGTWTSWDLYAERVATEDAVKERYVPAPPPAPEEPVGGPVLDLEGDEPVAAAEAPEDLKGPWVMEVFHQHVFSIGVVWLILAHLFMLCGLGPGAKSAVIAVSGVSSLGHVLAPPIIWKTGGFLWLMPVSGAAMGITWTLMIVITFVSLWVHR